MIPFTSADWFSSLILWAIFSTIVLVPCFLVAIIGRKMITRIGQYPTQTPVIQMNYFVPLLLIEGVTFFMLFAFYQLFPGQ